MRYAIVQGVDILPDSMMHVFAVDSRKHSLELFLSSADFMPSKSDAQELGGIRTPIVHVVVGSGEKDGFPGADGTDYSTVPTSPLVDKALS